MGRHDVAQICLNGHVANDSTQRYPEFNKAFCEQCGAATITSCPNCSKPIQGAYHVEGMVDYSDPQAPPFCIGCGHAFPWTEARIQAAKELAELELSEEDSAVFAESVAELVKDSPRGTLAAAKVKKIMSKAGKTFCDAARDILVDIVSETAKKAIWG